MSEQSENALYRVEYEKNDFVTLEGMAYAGAPEEFNPFNDFGAVVVSETVRAEPGFAEAVEEATDGRVTVTEVEPDE